MYRLHSLSGRADPQQPGHAAALERREDSGHGATADPPGRGEIYILQHPGWAGSVSGTVESSELAGETVTYTIMSPCSTAWRAVEVFSKFSFFFFIEYTLESFFTDVVVFTDLNEQEQVIISFLLVDYLSEWKAKAIKRPEN